MNKGQHLPAPTAEEMKEMEEYARKYPNSLTARIYEGRKRTYRSREKREMLEMPLSELEKQARENPDPLWAQMYEARIRAGYKTNSTTNTQEKENAPSPDR